MADLITAFEDLARLQKNAALRAETPAFRWATVATSSPNPTILFDNDDSGVPRRVSASAVGPVVAGQRVRVEIQGQLTTIVAVWVTLENLGVRGTDGSINLANVQGSHLRMSLGGLVELLSSGGARLQLGTSFVASDLTSAIFTTGTFAVNASSNASITSGATASVIGSTAQVMSGDNYWRANAGGIEGRATGNGIGMYVYQVGGFSMTSDGYGRMYNSSGAAMEVGATGAIVIQSAGGQIVRINSALTTNIQSGSTDRLIVTGGTGGTASVRIVNEPTTTAAANALIATSPAGVLYRSTSVRAAKAAIEPLEVDTDTYLNLTPQTWVDRGAADAVFDAMERERSGEEVDWSQVPSLRRIPGLVAEDVVESGNEWLVTYDDEDNPNGVSYDRGWIPAIPIIKDLRERVNILEHRVAQQDERISTLEAQVEQLIKLSEERTS